MAINTESERLLTLREAAAITPGCQQMNTLHIYLQQGIRGVKLESCSVNGLRYTSYEAIARFVAASTAARDE